MSMIRRRSFIRYVFINGECLHQLITVKSIEMGRWIGLPNIGSSWSNCCVRCNIRRLNLLGWSWLTAATCHCIRKQRVIWNNSREDKISQKLWSSTVIKLLCPIKRKKILKKKHIISRYKKVFLSNVIQLITFNTSCLSLNHCVIPLFVDKTKIELLCTKNYRLKSKFCLESCTSVAPKVLKIVFVI